jgi:ammonium transporter, Amt family
VLGLVTGAVAGLVAITPASGYVGVGASIAIGVGAAAVCYFGVNRVKARFGYDDSLDVFGVHGLGGTWGAIATGVFASKSINPAGADGLIKGHPEQLMTQVMGVLAAWVVAGIGTFVVLTFVKLLTSLRVTSEDEITGLDLAVHGEEAYNLLTPGMGGIATTGQQGTEHLADGWDNAEQAGSRPLS